MTAPKPMLAKDTGGDLDKVPSGWVFEQKLDGIRWMVVSPPGLVISRRGEPRPPVKAYGGRNGADHTGRAPAVEAHLSATRLPDTILDGELRAFIENAPFRAVKGIPEGPLNKPPDPHEYVIRDWKEIDSDLFGRFAKTIQRLGYKGRYTAPYNGRTMTNKYLVVDDRCYWYIYPKMLNRCRADAKQHEPLEEQASLA